MAGNASEESQQSANEVISSEASDKSIDKPPNGSSESVDKLDVIVTGDVFVEQFVWQDSSIAMEAKSLPYTAPDELREAESTLAFRELSGAPLHASIFKAMLKEFGFDGDVSVESTPSSDEIGEIWERVDGGPFPLYMHQLGTFAAENGRQPSDAELVWRIANSFGELRKVKPRDAVRRHANKEGSYGPVATRRAMDVQEKIRAVVKHKLGQLFNGEELESDTVVVVNDRHSYKHIENHTSARGMFGQIIQEADFPLPKGEEDLSKLLVVWHTRHGVFTENAIADILLSKPFARRTLAVLNYNCLRDAGVPLRFNCSYESSIRLLLDSLSHPVVQRLLHFPHVLIRFDYGLLHLSTDEHGNVCGLDIHGINAGPYAFLASRHGIMTGNTPLLIGAVLRELCCQKRKGQSIQEFLDDCSRVTPIGQEKSFFGVQHPTITNNTPIDRAIDLGLLASALHFQNGYGAFAADGPPRCFEEGTTTLYRELCQSLVNASPTLKEREMSSHDYSLAFRSDSAVVTAFDRLTRISVPEDVLGDSPDSRAKRPSFSRVGILRNGEVMQHSAVPLWSPEEKNNVDRVLRGIVEHGLDRVVSRRRLDDDFLCEPSILCPVVEFGSYLSVDSQDIDSFLSLRFLLDKYLNQADWRSPLAIAVFGKPGSGKSRIVKEVMQSVPGCSLDESLDCNMSQWSGLMHLTRQFRRLQDRVLHSRSTPVVVFDEFDSPLNGQEAGWLRYFLMPIQDGLYMDGDDTFHVGKSIFVFAGGVAHSYQEFLRRFLDLVELKVPDFVSRIRGVIDVQDVAYPDLIEGHGGTKVFTPTSPNCALQLRRAVLLRSLLRKNVPQIFEKGTEIAQISGPIIDAFLYVPSFTHGVRSMEAIIQMSRVSPRQGSQLLPSALPSPEQLKLHVDSSAFLKIVQAGGGGVNHSVDWMRGQ